VVQWLAVYLYITELTVGGAVVGSISVHYSTDSRWCSDWQYICTLLNWQ